VGKIKAYIRRVIMTDRLLIGMNILLMVALAAVTVMFVSLKREQGFFARVPVEEVHTMRVWEDGSFAIEYQDNTSEVGCVPGGLCND
jgi:hypothetical protein